MRSPHPEEEGAAETTCHEPTATPVPHPPVPLQGRSRETRSRAELEKKGGRGARIYFSLPSCELMGNKQISPPQVDPGLPVTITGE